MKCLTHLCILTIISLCAFPLQVKAAPADQEVPVPASWLLHRFVRASTSPSHTYHVAISVPPAASFRSIAPRVAHSSGAEDIDKVALDFVRDSIRDNASLRDMIKTKELYYSLRLTPPALDVKMRSDEGRRHPKPGQALYAPMASTFFVNPNQDEPASRPGNLSVVFPAAGGYAEEAMVTTSTGNTAADRYYLHSAALNWQTTNKAPREQVYRSTFSVHNPTRSESILDR